MTQEVTWLGHTGDIGQKEEIGHGWLEIPAFYLRNLSWHDPGLTKLTLTLWKFQSTKWGIDEQTFGYNQYNQLQIPHL